MDDITDADRARARELDEKATKGPWFVHGPLSEEESACPGGRFNIIDDSRGDYVCDSPSSAGNASFIAESRALLPRFFAAEARMREELAKETGRADANLLALFRRGIEVNNLRARVAELDCRYIGSDVAEVGGSHCLIESPCLRCRAEGAQTAVIRYVQENDRVEWECNTLRARVAELEEKLVTARIQFQDAARQLADAAAGSRGNPRCTDEEYAAPLLEEWMNEYDAALRPAADTEVRGG